MKYLKRFNESIDSNCVKISSNDYNQVRIINIDNSMFDKLDKIIDDNHSLKKYSKPRYEEQYDNGNHVTELVEDVECIQILKKYDTDSYLELSIEQGADSNTYITHKGNHYKCNDYQSLLDLLKDKNILK